MCFAVRGQQAERHRLVHHKAPRAIRTVEASICDTERQLFYAVRVRPEEGGTRRTIGEEEGRMHRAADGTAVHCRLRKTVRKRGGRGACLSGCTIVLSSARDLADCRLQFISAGTIGTCCCWTGAVEGRGMLGRLR